MHRYCTATWWGATREGERSGSEEEEEERRRRRRRKSEKFRMFPIGLWGQSI